MGTKIGPIMASGVTFEITVFGKGGHAALPQSTIDPVPVACFIVSHLQTLISRRMNPLDAAVLTIGKIEAGSSPNIIPSEAKIMGTCRTLTNEAQSLILDNMQRIAISIAEAHGAHAEVIIKQCCIPASSTCICKMLRSKMRNGVIIKPITLLNNRAKAICSPINPR